MVQGIYQLIFGRVVVVTVQFCFCHVEDFLFFLWYKYSSCLFSIKKKYHIFPPLFTNSDKNISHVFSNIRFNWGLTVKKKSERVLKLLERGTFLKEEREKARRLTHGIKGFGSLNRNLPSTSNDKMDHEQNLFGRSNSQYEKCAGEEREDLNQRDEMEKLVSSDSLVKRKAQSDFDQAPDCHPFVLSRRTRSRYCRGTEI